MPLFVKTETFSPRTKALATSAKKNYVDKHLLWVKDLSKSGIKISSGYLIDQNQMPGGGGFLIFEAKSYTEAKSIIEKDPMIISHLVDWDLHELKSLFGNLKISVSEEKNS